LVSVTISRDTNRPTVKEATSMADEKLADYVEDAHAMEQSVLRSLDSMISTTDDPEVRSMLEHH
jgi:ferritin-like metal-binding protein YciE